MFINQFYSNSLCYLGQPRAETEMSNFNLVRPDLATGKKLRMFPTAASIEINSANKRFEL